MRSAIALCITCTYAVLNVYVPSPYIRNFKPTPLLEQIGLGLPGLNSLKTGFLMTRLKSWDNIYMTIKKDDPLYSRDAEISISLSLGV